MAASAGSRGGTGKAGAIRAGGAFVEIFADDMSVIRALEKLKGYANAVGQKMRMAGALAIGGAAAMAAPIAAAFNAVVGRDVEMSRLANRFGDTVEQFSALQYAAEATGVSFDQFKEVLENLPERVDDAVQGGGEAAEVFKRMGLSAREFMALPLSEKFTKLADGLQGFSDDSKNSILGKLFSDKGQAFREMMDSGSAGIRKLMAEASTVGAVVSAEDAANARKVDSALSRAWAAAKGVYYSLGAALLPEANTIAKAADWVVKAAASVRDFIKENRQMVLGVLMGAAAIAGIGVTLIALGYGFTILGTAAGGIASALLMVKGAASIAIGSLLGVKAVIALIGFALSPLGIATAAFVGILALMANEFRKTETAKAAVNELGQAWGFVKTTALDAWGGIRDAVAAGDLNLAFKVAVAGLQVLWAGTVQALTDKWNKFKGFFVDGWNDAVMLFRTLWIEGQMAVGDGFLSLLQMIAERFEQTFTRLFGFAAQAAKAIGLDAVARELEMFEDLGKKGQLSQVFGEARKDLAKDLQQQSFDVTNQRQTDQEKSNQARAASQAAADADLAAAQADLAAAIAEAKVAAEKARATAKLPEKARGQLGLLASDFTRVVQGARDFSKIFSAGDTVNEKILQAQLKNVDAVQKVEKAIETGFAGIAPAAAFVYAP